MARLLRFAVEWLGGWVVVTVAALWWFGIDNSIVWVVVPVLALVSLALALPALLEHWEGKVIAVDQYLALDSPPGRDPTFHGQATALIERPDGKHLFVPAEPDWTIGDHLQKLTGEFHAHHSA